jgi:four helix bundle protein
MENTPKKYNLEERLINFAVMVLNLADQLPNTFAGKHLGGQITRSGTSPALNYGEAQGAESRADFSHKMKICLKELRETQICLKIIQKKNNMVKIEISEPVLKECNELVAIFTSSIEKIKSNNTLK